MASFIRFGLATLMVSSLVMAAGCGGRRDGRGGPTGDGGVRVPPPGSGPVEDGLRAADEAANAACPCQVPDEYPTVAACVEESTPNDDGVRCARETYAAMQSPALDAAIACQARILRSLASCVTTMGCDAAFACLSMAEACPSSPEYDAFDSAVDSCVGGDPPPPPPGPCTPMPIGSGLGAVAMGSTADATAGQSGSCNDSGAPEAVFVWTAPIAGTFVIDTNGSDFDTILYVRAESCSGEELGCDDDGGDGTQSMLSITAAAGQVFVIVVDGYSGSGNYVLNINPGMPTT